MDQSGIPKRPKPGEGEEELLRQMRDFEVSKSSIASENVVISQKRKTSKFAQQRIKDCAKAEEETSEGLFPSVRVLQSVVKERNVDYDQLLAKMPTPMKNAYGAAFPTVTKLDSIVAEDSGKSLFAQHLAAEKGETVRDHIVAAATFAPQNVTYHWGSDSRILTKILSDKERLEIHEGNVAMLNGRSDAQLRQDREELLQTLNPDIVQFLLKRKAMKRVLADEDKDDSSRMVVADAIPAPKKIMSEAKYLNMDTVETEKMEWMEDTAPADDDKPIVFSARFDFKGDLLPYDTDAIPVNAGLHHHGAEPHRPGYTLEELMTLSRSTNTQQASIAIQTLANVIRNTKQGRFIGCFNEDNIFVTLLETDLVTLLRITMDNQHSEVLLDASTQALADVLTNDLEESILDYNFFHSTSNGYIQPSLCPSIANDKDFKEEASELKDIEVMNADIVLGLLRTSILDRIAYLFEVQKPKSASTVTNMLKILIRLARHSLSTANILVRHDKLVKIITTNFLPLKVSSASDGILYGRPVHYALKLLRIIMSWGRNLAKEIIAKCDLGSKILCYLSIEPESSSLLQEMLRLIDEAGRCWIVCLRYGLEPGLFMEYHPILMRHLVYLNTHLSITDDCKASKFNYHFAMVIFEIINAAIHCAPNSTEEFKLEDRKAIQLLDWSAFTGILVAAELCLKKWTNELSRMTSSVAVSFSMDLLSSMLSLHRTFFERQSKSEAFDQVNFLKQLEDLVKFVTPLLLKSKTFENILSASIKESFFKLKTMQDGRSIDPNNLPSLGIIGILETKACIMPGANEASPFNNLATILDFFIACKKCHSSIEIAELKDILENELVKEYLCQVIKVNVGIVRGSRSNWFCKSEVNYLHKLIQSLMLFKTSVDQGLVICAALTLLTHYQIGDSTRAKMMMEQLVFSPNYIGDAFLALILEASSIDDDSDKNLSKINLSHLLEIYSRYIFKSAKELEQSRLLWRRSPFSTSSLVLNNHGETLLPSDWQYLPLLSIMSDNCDEAADDIELDTVKSCLTWVKIMNKCTGITSAVFCYSRLATVFLAASDLFLDQDIKLLIKDCLKQVLKSRKSLVFKASKLPGIDSFEDFYKELVQQFQAVSYGDSLFALMIMLPLVKGNDFKLSAIFWMDNMECLRSITLKNEYLIAPLKVEDFIGHSDNKDLVRAQVKALLAKIVTPERNPLIFDIIIKTIQAACAHDTTLKKEILSQMNHLEQYLS
jgi:hypothetical protein